MSNVYLTSDTHLGHRNIANFRVNGFTSEEQWSLSYEGLLTLKKRDTLMLLGDVAFDHYWLGKVKELPCKKVLIIGNHCVTPKITMKHLVEVYDKVFSLLSYKGHWLSHAPIHPMELRGKKNIHGHCHPCLMTKEVYGEIIVDDRYTNLSQEYSGLVPLNWQYVISEEYKQECLIKYKQFILEGKIKP